MSYEDAETFVEQLGERGLLFSTDDESDICIVDQLSGPLSPCRWLRFELDDQFQARCWWAGDDPGELAVPRLLAPQHKQGLADDRPPDWWRTSKSAADQTRRAECRFCGRLFATASGRDQHVAAEHRSGEAASANRAFRHVASEQRRPTPTTSINCGNAAPRADGGPSERLVDFSVDDHAMDDGARQAAPGRVGLRRRRDLVSRAAELLGASVAFLISAAVLIVVFGGGVVSRDACADRQTGQVSHGQWGIDPLAWFGATSVSEDKTCESETGWQFVAGKIPLVGDSLERTIGGPQNPVYYEGSDTQFEDRLVREVGAGSMALNGYDEFIAHATNFQGAYQPAENNTMEHLLRGDISEVSDSDLSALDAATDGAKGVFERELGKLRRIERGLRAAELPPARYDAFDRDTRDFLEAWNHLLLANAAELGGMTDYFEDARPMFAQSEQLVVAARQVQAGGRLSAYDRVRRETLRQLGVLVTSLRRLQMSDTTKAEKQVAQIYSGDTGSRVLVSTVNERYPDGYLAKRVSGSEDR
jgi:hypothetical protein